MVPSSQISGLIAGQQVMFANQAAYAHQIGGLAGGAQGGWPALQNPFPAQPIGASYGLAGWQGQSLAGLPLIPGGQTFGGFGAAAAGAMGMALPAAMTGMSLAGGLMGGAAGWLDPFTGTARAFRAGVGAQAGAGVMGTLGHVGQAFSKGGFVAGSGALGAGLGAAAMTALPYYAAFQGAQYVGEQMYAGAQNISQVGMMAQQHMGPAFGTSGARPGGQFGRGNVREMVKVLHELADDDVMLTMKEAKGLMDKAGNMGMLTGIRDAGEFRRRMREIVGQVRQVAQTLGTTLEEAAPLFGQMRQMGLWKTSDIMGATRAVQMVGPQAAGQMLSLMGQGAQMSHQMGGRLGAGARSAQETFLQLQSAVRSGVVRPEQIAELTGGLTGAEGEQAAAGTLLESMQRLLQHPAGQALIAGLGKTEGGRFTGQVDAQKLREFTVGGQDVGGLLGRGRQAAGSRAGALSFMNRKGEIGQELLAQGGLESAARVLETVMEKAGYAEAGGEVQNRFIQMIMGVNTREADFWQQLVKDLPRIMGEKRRREESALEDARRRLDTRMNRSFEGLRDSVSGALKRSIGSPIQQFAENLATQWSEGVDRLVDRAWGRTRGLEIDQVQRIRLLREQAGTSLQGPVGGGGNNIAALERSILSTPYAERARAGDRGSRAARMLGMEGLRVGGERGEGGVLLGYLPTFGDAQDLLRGVVTGTGELLPESGIGLGRPVFGQAGDLERVARRTGMRASARSLEALGMGRDADERLRPQLEHLRASYAQLTNDPQTANQIRKARARGVGDEEINRFILGRLRALPGSMVGALEHQGVDPMDQLAVVANQLGERDVGARFQDSDLAFIRNPALGQENFDEAIRLGAIALMQSAQGFAGEVAEAQGWGHVPGVRQIGMLFTQNLPSMEDARRAFTHAEWGTDFARYIEGGKAAGNKFVEAAHRGDPLATRMRQLVDAAGAKEKAALQQSARTVSLHRDIKVSTEEAKRLQELAGDERGAIVGLDAKKLGGAKVAEAYRSAVGAYEQMTPEQTGAAPAELDRLVGLLTKDKGARDALGGLGQFGIAGYASSLGEIGSGLSGGSLNRKDFNELMRSANAKLGADIMESLRLSSPEAFGSVEKMLSNDQLDAGEMTQMKDILQKFTKILRPQEAQKQVDAQQATLDYAKKMNELANELGVVIPQIRGDAAAVPNPKVKAADRPPYVGTNQVESG